MFSKLNETGTPIVQVLVESKAGLPAQSPLSLAEQ